MVAVAVAVVVVVAVAAVAVLADHAVRVRLCALRINLPVWTLAVALVTSAKHVVPGVANGAVAEAGNHPDDPNMMNLRRRRRRRRGV